MINGTIRIEDFTIAFYAVHSDHGRDTVTYTVMEQVENSIKCETVEKVNAEYFMWALGIALDYNGGDHLSPTKYRCAESILGEIRWIP